MSVYKRGDFWWCDFSVKGERHRLSTGLSLKSSKTAAREAERQLREAVVLRATPQPRPLITIHEAADKWFQATQINRKSAKTTARRVRDMLKIIGPDVLVSAIDTPEIAEALAVRRAKPTLQSTQAKDKAAWTNEPPSDSTVNRDMIDTTLRPILRYAKEILKQPVHDIPWQSLRKAEPKERVRSFTAEELAAWRGALPEWHRPLVDFMARYGVRLSEMFFRPTQVNIVSDRLTISDRKSGHDLIVPLLPEDARLMAERAAIAKEHKLATVWFRITPDGRVEPIRYRAFQSASYTAIRKAGIQDARPAHDFRHHAATTLLRSTGNMKVVQRLLGHENIASTARYAHADDEDVLNALRHTYGTDTGVTPEKLLENNGDA